MVSHRRIAASLHIRARACVYDVASDLVDKVRYTRSGNFLVSGSRLSQSPTNVEDK